MKIGGNSTNQISCYLLDGDNEGIPVAAWYDKSANNREGARNQGVSLSKINLDADGFLYGRIEQRLEGSQPKPCRYKKISDDELEVIRSQPISGGLTRVKESFIDLTNESLLLRKGLYKFDPSQAVIHEGRSYTRVVSVDESLYKFPDFNSEVVNNDGAKECSVTIFDRSSSESQEYSNLHCRSVRDPRGFNYLEILEGGSIKKYFPISFIEDPDNFNDLKDFMTSIELRDEFYISHGDKQKRFVAIELTPPESNKSKRRPTEAEKAWRAPVDAAPTQPRPRPSARFTQVVEEPLGDGGETMRVVYDLPVDE